MTPEQLLAIKERAAMATAGPWQWSRTWHMPYAGSLRWRLINPADPKGTINDYLVLLTSCETDWDDKPLERSADFEFIAAARQDVPDLIAEIERLQGELADRGR